MSVFAQPAPPAVAAEDTSRVERSPAPGMANVLVAAAGWLLFLLSADRVVRGLAAVQRTVEAMYGEAIVYGQAARLLHGEPLYQPLDQLPLTVTAYTPLYYAFVAGLRMLVGPGFGPGRALSLAAGLVAAILVGFLAARRATRTAGVFAALLFLGLGFPGDYPWFAFYKEDMLGVSLSLAAIAILEKGDDRRRTAIAAGALAGLAFLTKQTFVAASVAGVVWLVWRRQRANALSFGGAVLLVVGLPCLLLALFDDGFLANTLGANLNPTRPDILLSNLGILGRYLAIPLVIAVLPVLSRARSGRSWLRDPLVLFWLVSLLPLPVELAKAGSNWNYWIELAAATAALATRAVWQLTLTGRAPGMGRLAASIALCGLLVTPVWLPHPADDLWTVVGRALAPDQHQATEFAGVLERVRSEPRRVLAEPLDIVALADRDVLFEPYIYSIRWREGQWDASSLIDQICAGQFGLLVLDHPIEGPDWEYQGYPHWPEPVLAALRATMRLDREQANLFLYVPRVKPGADAANQSTCGA
jgi:hypothetical protein